MPLRLNSSLTMLGARPYFTLYINIAISCSLRFSSEGSPARTRRFSYDSEWELNTALSARFWIRSIFLLSEDLQLCHKIYAIPDGNMLSEAGWMICRLSVLLCMVSNFAVSIRHHLFDWLLCKCYWYGWWN